MEHEGFDAELQKKLAESIYFLNSQLNLQKKLASKLYSFSQITRDTGISRYWLNNIKNNAQVPSYIIVALNDYFKKVS